MTRAPHGRKATKRTAYITNLVAIIPDEVDPGVLRRVSTRVLFFDCGSCGALAGYRCKRDEHYVTYVHGDRGHGKKVPYADRIAMAAGLIASKRFDEVHVISSTSVLRAGGEE